MMLNIQHLTKGRRNCVSLSTISGIRIADHFFHQVSAPSWRDFCLPGGGLATVTAITVSASLKIIDKVIYNSF
jgi:hypothetical protein